MKPAAIFQNGMILQRNKPVVIWGTGARGETIRGEIQGRQGEAAADAAGNWTLTLPPLDASDEEELVLRSVSAAGESEAITFSQVAVGEVWVAGGQSNMEFHMRYEKHRAEALKNCSNPRVRFFDVPEVSYDGQAEEFDYSRMGIWRKADPENLEYFSAVGYYFERELERVLDVPVGIIGCNWGGTRSCAWMSAESVERAGKPWMQMYEDRIAEMDLEEYWEKQHGNPMNHRGDPFGDPFGETVLPRTLSPEELADFFQNMPAGTEDYLECMMPCEIPGSLYEHMLKTIAPYGIRGFLWYQGESDDEPGKQCLYRDMLAALIGDWRALWKDAGLPFLFVQLPGWENWLLDGPGNRDYMTIRSCQEMAARTVSNAYLCSISDAGEQMDIHPKDKKVVGERLALLARGHVYGESLLCDAPMAESIRRDGSRIEIVFQNAEGGLKVKGDAVEALHVYPVEFSGAEKPACEEAGHGAGCGDECLTASDAEGDADCSEAILADAGEESRADYSEAILAGTDAEDSADRREEIPVTADVEGEKLVILLPEGIGKVSVEFARTRWYLVNLYNQADIPAIPFELIC